MEMVWTEVALDSFYKVVDYLFDYWSVDTINAFEEKVDKLIEKISNHSHICPEAKLFGYRKCVIDEQNSMIYHIINDKLLIVVFVDNRSQHSF